MESLGTSVVSGVAAATPETTANPNEPEYEYRPGSKVNNRRDSNYNLSVRYLTGGKNAKLSISM